MVGLLDAKLSQKLQLDPELTLPKAVTQARQSEAIKKQQTLMRNDFKESTGTKNKANAVKTEKFRKDNFSGSPDETPNSKKLPTHLLWKSRRNSQFQETANSSTLESLLPLWEIAGPRAAKLSS